jgi:hypothetical protein
MKLTYLKYKWKMWEQILKLTGWLFGYGHEAYYGVKDNRNQAYFEYIFTKKDLL